MGQCLLEFESKFHATPAAALLGEVARALGMGSHQNGRHSVEHPAFIIPPGYGEHQRDLYHYAQAVKIGNRIETAGQGGWTDTCEYPTDRSLREEITRAFDNVEYVLKAAGASWDDVVAVNSYHIFPSMKRRTT